MQSFDWDVVARLVGSPARLRAVARANVALAQDLPAVRAFIARVRQDFAAEWAGISLVDAQIVDIVAASGAFSIAEQLSVEDSFCALAVAAGDTLAIHDAQASPSSRRSLLVRAMDIRAYLGAPFYSAQGEALGALNLLSRGPRRWQDAEIDTLRRRARQFEDRLQPALARLVAGERRRFLDRIRSDQLRRLCEDWYAVAGSGGIPHYDEGVAQVLADADYGALAEVTQAAPFRCRITRMGQRLEETLRAQGGATCKLTDEIDGKLKETYQQCFFSGTPTYERLSMRLQHKRVGFERLLLPFRALAVDHATHLVAYVTFSGLDL